ncbi:methyl-accepting chemotaxis protein [Bdellovibrio sp. NC01]|uniref:HAMP domain-containing methyl-accepting chemotaxis protein n=1 Tax=Bdellovibrio sp. NC01 TaxID=2220073 RepID=UPI00143D5D28|nr:methyl-accepting chemotaxis protein [Bdellovibrio sp. NC01]
MFQKLFSGIRGKLLLLACLPLVFSAVGTWLTFNRADRMSASIQDLTKNVIPTVQAVGEIRKSRNASRQWFWSAVVHAKDSDKRIAAVDKSIAEFKILEKSLDDYEKTPFVEFEKNEFPAVKAMLPEYKATFYKIAQLIKEGSQESIDQATSLMDHRYLELGTSLSTYCEKVMAYYNKVGAEESIRTQQNHSELKQANLWTSIISSVILWVITFLMSESIVRNISNIAEHLMTTGKDVRESIEQLSQAGDSLSKNSTSAAASLEETVASLEEINSMVRTNSENAQRAATLSDDSYKSAERGEVEIKLLISSMQSISESSKKIEEIINVIDDIAFQTNLLALNAAVEAARAGEQGKGFAVVAEAVRGLAHRSSLAAKDISQLIGKSVAEIENGSKIADRSGVVLSDIVQSVKQVSDLNGQIAEASHQQNAGLSQVNQAMANLDQSSQSNAAAAEQIAAASGEIRGQAMNVESDVLTLNTFVAGKRERTAPKAA